MPNLVVEIGTEELPVDALDVIYSELTRKAAELFQKNRLSFKKIEAEATPRRIAFFADSLAARQEDIISEISGPTHEKAYDANGAPTPALEGFLKSKNAKPADIQIRETPRGKYVVLRKKQAGRPANSLLPALLKEIFEALSFPKTMRWEKTGFRYARPVRWIVALLDKQLIP